MSNSVYNNDRNLIFFDKEGNQLNIYYDENSKKYNSKLYFDENSDDTFKTYGLYVFEKIPSFAYENNDGVINDYIKTKRLQLFNEYGIFFKGNNGVDASYTIDKIISDNYSNVHYTKWITSKNIEKNIEVGDNIIFNLDFLDIVKNKPYQVIDKKKDNLLILTTVDNYNFNINYENDLNNPLFFNNKTLSVLNTIIVNNYNNISDWNERNFQLGLTGGDVLSVSNDTKNTGVFRVKQDVAITEINNNIFNYNLSDISGGDLLYQVKFKTNTPILYDGAFEIVNNSVILENTLTSEFKGGIKIKFTDSLLNQDEYTISEIPFFDKFKASYITDDLVIFNNKIYRCVIGYIQDSSKSITPRNRTYWELSYKFKLNESLSDDSISNSQIIISDDILNLPFNTSYTNPYTIASLSLNEYIDTFSSLGLDATINDGGLVTIRNSITEDTIDVDVYNTYTQTNVGVTTSGSIFNTNINLVSKPYFKIDVYVNDVLYRFGETTNNDCYFSNNNGTSALAITSIDTTSDFIWNGAKSGRQLTSSDVIKIVYTRNITVKANTKSLLIPLNDNVIANVNNNLAKFEKNVLSITDLDNSGLNILINNTSYFVNTDFVYVGNNVNLPQTINKTLLNWYYKYNNTLNGIGVSVKLKFTNDIIDGLIFTSLFPNINYDIAVIVGNGGNYFFNDSKISLTNIYGNTLTININGRDYSISNIQNNIIGTLESFVSTYYDTLINFDIYIESISNSLYFYKKDSLTKINLSVNNGVNDVVGYETKFIKPIHTSFIEPLVLSCNKIINTNDISFEDYAFSTGQITSLNNSEYKLNNKEYNILNLNPNELTLSYQGVFFDSNYSATHSHSFTYSTVDISNTDRVLKSDYIEENDIIVNLITNVNSNRIDIYKNNVLIKSTIVDGSDFIYNNINKSVYIVSSNKIVVYDINTYTIIKELIPNIAIGNIDNISIDNNGYLYIAHITGYISIYNHKGIFVIASQYYTNTSKLVYNSYYDDMYVFNSTNLTKSYVKINSAGVYNSSFNIYINNIVLSSVYSDSANGIIYVLSNTSVGIYELFTLRNDILVTTNIIGNSDDIYYCSNLLSEDTHISYPTLSSDYHVIGKMVANSYNIGKNGKIYYNPNDAFIYISDINDSSISVVSSLYNNIVFSTILPYYIDDLMLYSSDNIMVGFNYLNYIWFNLNFYFLLTDEYFINSDLYLIKNQNSSSVLLQNSTVNINEPMYGGANTKFTNLFIREYIRFPRENYENFDSKVKYKIRWENDEVEDMFLYDISGNQLKENGIYTYIGEKPLKEPKLIYVDNTDITKVKDSSYQKTVFGELEYELEYIDSTSDITFEPEPMQIFIGYNSKNEGVTHKKLFIEKHEDSILNIDSTSEVSFIFNEEYSTNKIIINTVGLNLSDYFKVEQVIKISVKDNINKYNKYTSKNDGKRFAVKMVYYNELLLDKLDEDLYNEVVTGDILDISIVVIPKVIAEFNLYGQTEIEDIRYKIELTNTGKLVNTNDAYIFEEYDINEGGSDWKYINKKRKEMLMVRNDIYNYIGSYKSIINAINYFGYNDLELYEYLRNINIDDPLYDRLIKIRIPDIFNNDVKGWKDENFFSNIFSDENYETTNLFNLTYNITDENGDNAIAYSLDDIIVKLSGLKRWLTKNIIPITHKIKDITGVATVEDDLYIVHNSHMLNKVDNNNTLSTVSIDVKEVNKIPIESGSNVFNVVIEPKDYGNDYDYYNINVRTYKTYDEWDVFKKYFVGDIVYYSGKHYVANQDNQTKNPILSLNYAEWDVNTDYKIGDIVSYLDKYYVKTYANIDNDYVYLNESNLGYETDLLNTLLNNKPSYFSIPSDRYYAGLDVLNTMNSYFTGSTTLNSYTYSGVWSTSSQFFPTLSVPPINLYRIGYNATSMVSGASNVGYGSASYSLSVSSLPNPNTSTNLSGFNITLVNSIELTPNLSVDFEPAKIYYFRVSNITFNNVNATIAVGVEISPNNYVNIGTFDSTMSGTIDIPFSVSNYTRPRFRIIQYTNLSNQSGVYVSYISSNTFDYIILEADGVTSEQVKTNPELLNSNILLQNGLAEFYYNNGNFGISNITPTNLNDAYDIVSNMIQNYQQNRFNYKERFKNLSPLQNKLLNDKMFVIWEDITYWSEVDLKPVQYITEFRSKGDIRPLNITIDSYIDPYIKIDAITDNGYGLIYKYTKNFDVRYNADR